MWHRRRGAGPRGAGSGGLGPAGRDRDRALGSPPALSPPSASLRRPAGGPFSMACPLSVRLPLRASRNRGWSLESGTWPRQGALLSASSCALSSPGTATLGVGLGRAGRHRLGPQGPRGTQKGLGSPLMRARRGRAVCPQSLTLLK